jgi:hypothetical protein
MSFSRTRSPSVNGLAPTRGGGLWIAISVSLAQDRLDCDYLSHNLEKTRIYLQLRRQTRFRRGPFPGFESCETNTLCGPPRARSK